MQIIKNNIGNEAIVFAQTFEYEAFDQIKKLINFEAYQDSIIRVMPDAHAGKGCVVGTTMTIKDKVTPNLVGVDIGCGMLTIKLKEKDIDFARLDNIINNKIPSGKSVHTESKATFNLENLKCKKYVDIGRASLSIGTLGGGNHFIEVGRSEVTGDLFLIIHSGSRKLGSEVCKYYQDLAFQNVNEMSKIVKNLVNKLKSEGRQKEIEAEIKKIKKPSADKELAFLTGEDFKNYMNDMSIVQEYASFNRETMAKIILQEMRCGESSRFETIHNYIDFRRMILRKGAVSAEESELLLIPINMRDGSLICIGKGNKNWNYSAPHGAGRLMSRTSARENLNLEEFKNSMEGIYSTSVLESTLDEAPLAYKSMEEIVSLIQDTVIVIDTIKPLYNYKAH